MDSQGIRYFVTCARGMEALVAAELRADLIGAREVEEGSSGVWFRGGIAEGYRANLWLRSGVRVLAEFARAVCIGPEELYAWARGLPWTDLLRKEQTFSVEARVWDSVITHSKYAALRIKDALCDTFRARFGERPSVDIERADLPLFLYLYRDEAVLYRDLSGTTLHKRGYRDAMHKSSLNEAVAAGMILRSGWRGEVPFCDPMCGSGTLGIEAALRALRRAPGLARKRFPFESWPDFDRSLWKDCKACAHAEARYELPAPIMLNDVHEGALALARKDAEKAGVASFMTFSHADIAAYEPPDPPGLIAVNPPWGRRLQTPGLDVTWRKLGEFIRKHGCEAWVFSGSEDGPRYLGRQADHEYRVMLAKVPCRMLRYG